MSMSRRNRIAAATIAAAFIAALGPASPLLAEEKPSAEAIVSRLERLMYPDAKAVATLHFKKAGEARSEDYEMVYYSRDKNQKIIVRMIAPASASGNDLLMLDHNVWSYDKAANRVMKIASNLSFGGTGFSYGDVVRLNFSENYIPSIKGEDAGTYLLEFAQKDRSAPYFRIELWVAKDGGWPVKGIYYARNGSVVKEVAYSDVRDTGAGRKPAVLTVATPLDPGAVNVLTIRSEAPRELPERLFNKRSLETRSEDNF